MALEFQEDWCKAKLAKTLARKPQRIPHAAAAKPIPKPTPSTPQAKAEATPVYD